MILTKKKAWEICIELWTWLAETGEWKGNWPKWKEYGHMQSLCPLCEYSNCHSGKGGGCNCPLDKYPYGCLDVELSYFRWSKAVTIEDRKKYAKEFLEQLKAL